MLACYVHLHIISQHAKILNTASRYSRRLSFDRIIPMFSYVDTTENVPHLGDERVAGRKVALRTSAPRKTTEIGAEESAPAAGTAAGPGPETGKEPGESLHLPPPTKIVVAFLNGNLFPSVMALLLFRRSRSRDRRRSRSRERRRSNSRTRTRRSRSGSPTKSRRDER